MNEEIKKELQKLDNAVDVFAKKMKERLAEKCLKGYRDWDDPLRIDEWRYILQNNLERDLRKGKEVDIANYAMMIHLLRISGE